MMRPSIGDPTGPSLIVLLNNARIRAQNKPIDNYIATIPKILRYVEKIPITAPIPNVTKMEPNLPTLAKDSIRSILNETGRFPFNISKSITTPIVWLEEKCFEGISEREIMSSLEFAQTNPGAEYDASFYILISYIDEFGSKSLSGGRVSRKIKVLENGELTIGSKILLEDRDWRDLDAYSMEFDPVDRRDFINTLIRKSALGKIEDKEIICFFPSLEAVKLFVSNRVSCNYMGDFPSFYYQRVTEALESIEGTHRDVFRDIIGGSRGMHAIKVTI